MTSILICKMLRRKAKMLPRSYTHHTCGHRPCHYLDVPHLPSFLIETERKSSTRTVSGGKKSKPSAAVEYRAFFLVRGREVTMARAEES